MSKISELSDGGSLTSTDYLIAVRSGGNVKVRMDQINVDQVDLGDNEFIRLGNSQDLTMVHTSTQSIINQAGIGDLLLQKAGATKLTINASGIGVTGSVTATGDFTVDAVGDIILDADTGVWRFKDAGTTLYQIAVDGASVVLYTGVSDADMVFKGNDGGSTVTALTLDMSAAGAATFNSSITIPDYIYHTSDANTYFGFPGGDEFELITAAQSRMKLVGSETTFNEGGNDKDFRVESNDNANALFVDGGNNSVGLFAGAADTVNANLAVGLTGVAVAGDTDGATIGKASTVKLVNSNNYGSTDAGVFLLGGGTGGGVGQISSGLGFFRENSANWGTQLRFYVHETATSDIDMLQEVARFKTNEFVINETSHDYDFRVESDAYVSCLQVNAAENAVNFHKSDISVSTSGFSVGIPSAGVTSSMPSGNTYHVYRSDGVDNGYKFYVNFGGQINSTSTSISSLSDERLKENIVDLETGLSEVMALKPRRFDWKNSDNKNVAGFIAQEVETVLPELIGDFLHDDLADAKSVKMGDMVPTLVKAIQEQQELIKTLEARIAALES
jgi:hypothetical protein